MDQLHVRQTGLYLEQTSLTELADEFGTPVYAYSRAAVEDRWRTVDRSFGEVAHQVCYAVKACSNIAILHLLARLGSGFEVVSGGELYRVIKAGGDPGKVIFSGVGKRTDEIEQALRAGIRCLNIESSAELTEIERIATEQGVIAPVAFRVNPDIDVDTHVYITTGREDNKFGIATRDIADLYRYAANSKALEPIGIGCHIGSQITDLRPLAQAARRMIALAEQLTRQGLSLQHVNLGGGLGIGYEKDTGVPSVTEYVKTLLEATGNCPWEIIIEPGRSIVGDAGLLLTRVMYLKAHAARHFAVVDAAMNDLLRPALYQSYHEVLKVSNGQGETKVWDIVGPVCESGDFLARDCSLPLAPNDLLAILSTGAYGFSMASHYNSRPNPPEVLVDGDRAQIIRMRETPADLTALECLPGER